MKLLQIVYAPNEIFKQKAEKVSEVNDEIREIIDSMFRTMEVEQAVGLGANMVGILKRIIVLDMREDKRRYAMINPEIINTSEETQSWKESSLSFPGIEAEITRAKKIKVKYLDYDGNEQILEAEDFMATVIQHEMDYIDGRTFLDHLSKLKQDRLIKKMLKFIKHNPPHIHGEHCNH